MHSARRLIVDALRARMRRLSNWRRQRLHAREPSLVRGQRYVSAFNRTSPDLSFSKLLHNRTKSKCAKTVCASIGGNRDRFKKFGLRPAPALFPPRLLTISADACATLFSSSSSAFRFGFFFDAVTLSVGLPVYQVAVAIAPGRAHIAPTSRPGLLPFSLGPSSLGQGTDHLCNW